MATTPMSWRWLMTALLLGAALAAPASAAPGEGVSITTPASGGIYVNGAQQGTSAALAALNTASVKGNLDIQVAWQCPQGAVGATIKTEILKVTIGANGPTQTPVKDRTISGGAQGQGTSMSWGPAKAADAGDYVIKVTVTCYDRDKKVVGTYSAERNVVWAK